MLYCLDRASGKILWEKVGGRRGPGEEAHREQLGQFHARRRRRARLHHLPRYARRCASTATTSRATRSGRSRRASSTPCTASARRRCSTRTWSSSTATRTPEAAAYIVALDKQTGEEQWRTDRPNKTRSYCPPVVIDAAGKKQLVLTGSKCVASYDPDTGKQHWIIDGPTEQFVSSMVLHDGVLLMTAGYPDALGDGDRPERQRERDQDARPLGEAERGRLRAVAGGPQRQALPRR